MFMPSLSFNFNFIIIFGTGIEAVFLWKEFDQKFQNREKNHSLFWVILHLTPNFMVIPDESFKKSKSVYCFVFIAFE